MKQLLLAAFTALFFTACNNSATTPTSASDSTANLSGGTAENSKEAKEERNKRIVEAGLKGFENNNMDVVFKDAAPDVVDYGDGSMKPVKSLDSLKAGMKMWMDAMADYKGSDFTTVADGDNVMVYGTWSGTWKNDMMGMKATGKSFKVKDVDFFKLNDAGKITEHRNVIPMSEIDRQIGMKMPGK